MTPPARLRWSDLSQDREVDLCFSVTAEDMAAFAQLSGDYNPLHQDDCFARAKGFAGRVVYGGLLVAQVSRMIGMHLPGQDAVWFGIKMDFRNPLYVGETAQLTCRVAGLSESTRTLDLRLAITCDDRRIATGRADIQVRAND